MSRTRAFSIALVFAASACSGAGPARAGAWVPADPARHEAIVVIAPPQTVYPLPDRFVLAGTDTAVVRGRVLVSGKDYFLDAVAGEFRLNSMLAPGDTVRVRYRALRQPLERAAGVLVPVLRRGGPSPGAGRDTSFASRDSSGVGAGSAAARAGAPLAFGVPVEAAQGGGASLTLTGNKTVAVDFGNTRDVALRQSLDLNATGQVAPGVDVVAVLSDRNTPLSSEGASVELRELDKILLEVKGPNAGGALGDVSLRQDRGTFARYARELTGITAHGKTGSVDGIATLAGGKGNFVSRQFNGLEGLQGPYPLPDDQGRTGTSIVAGSEVVWLDGQKLTRGETADYSMDYDRGQITFSARRLISSASRIAIDYQVALTDYRRNVSSFAGGVTRAKLEAWGQVYREADSKYRPLHTTLTDEDVFILSQAGNDPSKALGNGIVAGPGDYVSFVDSAGITRFTFKGIGLGDFAVAFTRTGSGADYAESTQVGGKTIYRFAGAGQGDVSIGRTLPLPTALDVVNGGMTYRPWSFARVGVELAGSRWDQNTFSSLDDDARNGAGAEVTGTIEGPVRMFGKGLGRMSAQAGMRRFDERFRTPGRLDPAFYEEEWGVNAQRALLAQDRKSGAFTWIPRPALSLGAEYGELAADSGFFAKRQAFDAVSNATLSGQLHAAHVTNRQEGSPYRDEGFRDKLAARMSWGGWAALRPEASFDVEARVPPAASDSAAVRYRQWDLGMGLPRVGPLDVSLGYGQRDDDTRSVDEWFASTHADRYRGQVSGSFAAGITAAVGLEHRRQTPEATGAPAATSSDAGFARARQPIGDRGGEHSFAFEWSNQAEELRQKSVVFVGPGAGAFDSLGNFTGQGDYTVVLTSTGSFDRVVRSSGSYRAELRPANWFGESSDWSQRLADARGSLLVQSSQSRRGPFGIADLLYTPKRILVRDDVSSGSYLIRPELEFGTRTRFASFLFRLERRSAADRQFEGQSTTRDEWSEEGRWRMHPDRRWLGEVGVKLGQSNATQASVGFVPVERRLLSQSLTGEATYLPSEIWRVGLVGSYDQAKLEDSGTDPSTVFRAGPRIVYQRGGRFRSELLARAAAIGGGPVPVLLPNGFPVFPDKFDFTLDVSFRVRERANLVFTANGRKPDQGDFVQSGRAELRAYF